MVVVCYYHGNKKYLVFLYYNFNNLFHSLSHIKVSIGLLGVISEVTIQCERSFNLEETTTLVLLDQCLKTMEATARGSQHVKYWIELYTNSCAVFETKRTSEKPRDNPNHVLQTAKVSNILV